MASDINPVLERQLLLQLGDRLKRLRKAQRIGTVEMSEIAGIARNTLRAIEAGDPGPSIGNYLRVMSILGISGELALLAGDIFQPPPPESAGARSRRSAQVVQVRISADDRMHQLQDLQSLALHEEAVRLAKANPGMLLQAQDTVKRWLITGDSRSAALWRDWQDILSKKQWRKVLGRTRHAQQLRQTSPLVTILSEEVRQGILMRVSDLKKGITIDGTLGTPPDIDEIKAHL